MAIKLNTSFVSTNRPGSYIDVKVKSTPAGVGSVGNIVIIGEADAGLDFTQDDVLLNYYTPDQVNLVQDKYVRGPIVDAMRMLGSPSADPGIQGSASRVFIVKTNGGSFASAPIAGYGTLSDKIGGADGNKFSYKIMQTQAEVAPKVTSDDLTTTMLTPVVLNGLEFGIRVNGGAVTTVTLSANTIDHDTVPELAAEINAQLPSGISCVDDGDTIVFELDAVAANALGYGRSFELIDSTPGDLAVIGLDAGLIVSSAEPEISVSIVRPDINANETLEASADVAFAIGYEGTTASMVIAGSSLTTTVVGGAGSNLAVDLNSFSTVQALSDYINAQAGYSAAVIGANSQLSPLSLDKVTISIASSASAIRPGRVKKACSVFKNVMATSQYLNAEVTAVQGLPAAMASFAFLSGGAKGGTTAADIVDALDALEGIDVNFVVPLFSRDASLDIADGLTDATSTYTLDAIHAAAKSHVLKMSQVKLKKNRILMASFKGSYADAKLKASTLATYRAIMCMQDVTQVDSQGAVNQFQPWMQSVIAAGMQSAGFYKSLMKKFANVISVIDPSGFNNGSPGSVEDALDSGIMFMEKVTAGIRWVSDQSTYLKDQNFVYNSLQATYDADVVSLDLAASLENAYVGQSLADVDAATVLAFISNKMDGYKRLKLIGTSEDAPAGYRNVSIEIDGPIMSVKLEIKLSSSIYFIPITMEISQITSSAEG